MTWLDHLEVVNWLHQFEANADGTLDAAEGKKQWSRTQWSKISTQTWLGSCGTHLNILLADIACL